MIVHPNFLAGTYLDRRAEEREAPDWREVAVADPGTVYVIACSGRPLLYLDAEPRTAFLRGDDPVVGAAAAHQFILLGWFGSSRCVLVDQDQEASLPLPAGSAFEELRSVVGALGREEAALLAYVRALSIWRSRHRYCGVCGASTEPRSAGHVLRCSNTQCAHEVFPRLDPAIIVLVSDGKRALLGRQASWLAGRYSTLAGFVEPGESLEDAVVREVFEETGVRVHEARYHSSQPWPFPSSLMIGFYASATADAIRLGDELEDARWFTPGEIQASGVLLPPAYSISHRLITEWLRAR